MKNADYWRGRASVTADAAQRKATRCVADLEDMYLEAERTVRAEIERWYGRFAENNQISMTEARKMLAAGELEEFKWTVEKYIQVGQQGSLSPDWMKQLENASARFHISRLEAVDLQIQQQIELLYGNQLDSVDHLLREIVGEGYTRTAFEIQKGVGLGWDITALNQKKLDTLLTKPWTADKKTFRDRCWEGKANLVNGVQTTLTQGMLRGDSPQKITDAVKKRFNVSRYQAGRLVHTETTYFNAAASHETYKELGVEKVEIIETLDAHTCPICQPLDGTVIPMSQYEPGVTVPPFHPNCRGTTAPAIDPNIIGERAARDADGKVYYVPSDMTYADWQQTFAQGGSKVGLTTALTDGIIRQKESKDEGSSVQTVGYINKDIYRCITDDIRTDEVVITDERIGHIKERHPGDYERFMGYIPQIISDPDYIIEANKPNTAVILKEMEENGEKFKLVLRMKVEHDPMDYKNSVISFWKIGNTTWKKTIKNKKILYKKE